MKGTCQNLARKMVSVVSAVVLALSLCPISQAFAGTGGGQPSEPSIQVVKDEAVKLYVSKNGNDEWDGTRNMPYASLAKAVKSAPSGATIYVMTDLTVTESARYWDKELTITSENAEEPKTLTRDNDFGPSSDENVGGYNGAMIEAGNTGSLTITNLILDDDGNREGEHYVQVAPYDQNGDGKLDGGKTLIGGVGVDNFCIVQDGVITTYSESMTITLGNGAVIKNFGGMSAVRVSGGTLIMESGSKICDDKGDIDRTKQPGDYGFAGAVWVQSGNFTLKQGATIYNTDGHAVYSDGADSKIEIYGEIRDMSSDGNAWNTTAGVALHLRNNSEAKLFESSSIKDIDGSGGSIIYIEASSFDMRKGSGIRGDNGSLVGVQLAGTTAAAAIIDGEITGVKNSAVHMNNGNVGADFSSGGILKCTIGEHALIHKNSGNPYGTVTMQTNKGQLDVYGKIVDNFSTGHVGICMAHNVGLTSVTLHEDAEVSRNYSTTGVAGINVSFGNLTMEKGAIVSGNVSASTADDRGAGVFVAEGGHFVMNGGTVSGNISAGSNAGVSTMLSDWEAGGNINVSQSAQIVLNSGNISGNKRNATVATKADGITASVEGGTPSVLSISGTEANYGHQERFLSVSDDVSLDHPWARFTRHGGFDLSGFGSDVKLGNVSGDAEKAAKDTYIGQGLTEVVGSFWYETGGSSRNFSVSGLNYDRSKPLYAAVVATGKDGKPDDGAKVMLRSVETEGGDSFSVDLPGQSENGYAVVFLQQADSANVVAIVPADVTVYEGGNGYGAIVDEDGNISKGGSMPYPLFKITGVDDPTDLSFSVDGEQKAWTVKDDGAGYYHFEPVSGQNNVRVAYTDATGNRVTRDSVDVSVEGDTFKQFDIDLYLGDNDPNGIVVSNSSSPGGSYKVALGTGILTVRAVEAEDPGAVVAEVQDGTPTAPLDSGTAAAVEPEDGTEYKLNGTEVKLPSDGSAPSLLFDDIVDDGADRTGALLTELKRKESIDDGASFQAKYLDLVDANNSNAWITSSEGTDVYWGYPEGTDEDTEFALYHFEGLHRDGPNSGYDVDDVDSADIETVNVENTGQGIKFHVDAGGFSPYVLVWEASDGDGGGTVTPPSPRKVTLHYETNGGRPIADEQYDVGAKAELKTPLREGCTFAGWYLDEALTVPAESPVTMDSDKTVWAKWETTAVPDGFTSHHVNYILGRETDEGRLVAPEENVTRAEVAAMFYRLLDEGTRLEYHREESTFPDVEEGAWYEVPVATMQAMGILLGDAGTGTCRPDDPITRAEFAAMAGRFDDDGGWPDMEPFSDMGGHWAERIVLVAAENGWILGDEGSDEFRPDDPITRAEAIAVTNRVLQRLPEDESDLLPGRVEWPDNQDKGKWYWLAVEEATNSHDRAPKGDGVHEKWTMLLRNEDWA